ncbi:unnamed protein product [Prunus armeniaca]
MDAKIESIEKNDTWELTYLPWGQKIIDVQWVFKTKLNEKGEIDKHKARLVAKGYKQELDTIRLVVSIATQNSWPIFQLDVKSTFPHGDLQEQVYIEQPSGYVKQGNEEKVYRLNKALHILKQAPRAWYSLVDAYFTK